MSKLIMLVGVSGAGKSYMANLYKDNREVDEIVSSDALRAELFGDENDQTHNKEVFDEAHKRIKDYLKEGKNVCFDATNLSRKRRTNFLKELNGLDVEKECRVILNSFDNCVKNQLSRERKVSEEVIRRQIQSFNCPYWYEGWDEIVLVNMAHVPLTWFMQMNDIPHDNSHHSLDIKTHMELTGQIAYNMFDVCDLVCRLAYTYHDIGKFFCKSFTDKKGAPTTEATYYNHQNAGAYFFLLDTHSQNILGVQGTLEAAMLIQYHMEFFFREEKGMEKLRGMLGDVLFKELEVLHQCDLAAH